MAPFGERTTNINQPKKKRWNSSWGLLGLNQSGGNSNMSTFQKYFWKKIETTMHFMIYFVLDSKRFPNAISIFWSQKKTSFTNTEPPKYKANCKEIKTAQKIALLTVNFLGSCSNNAVLKRPQTSISYKNPCNPRKKSWVWRLAGFFLDLQITTSESLRSHDFFG